jgi:hypothetical protein
MSPEVLESEPTGIPIALVRWGEDDRRMLGANLAPARVAYIASGSRPVGSGIRKGVNEWSKRRSEEVRQHGLEGIGATLGCAHGPGASYRRDPALAAASTCGFAGGER